MMRLGMMTESKCDPSIAIIPFMWIGHQFTKRISATMKTMLKGCSSIMVRPSKEVLDEKVSGVVVQGIEVLNEGALGLVKMTMKVLVTEAYTMGTWCAKTTLVESPTNIEWKLTFPHSIDIFTLKISLIESDRGGKVFQIHKYSLGPQGAIGGVRVQMQSFCLVGKAIDLPFSTKKGAHDLMADNEATSQSMILIARLWASHVSIVPRVSTRESSSPSICREFYRMSARNDLMETKAHQVARFVRGLRWLSMHLVFILMEAISLATSAER
jgi:hypothetical protein